MLGAELRVVSENLSAEEISHVLDLAPDRVRAKGEQAIAGSHRVLPFTLWAWGIKPDEGEHLGTEGISRVLLSLGADVATRFREVGALGATVALSIVQEIYQDDDEWEQGLHIEPGALKWLADAGASIDVDQYLYTMSRD